MIASPYADQFGQDLNDKHGPVRFEVQPGRVYDKILSHKQSLGTYVHTNVYAFIVRKTGELVKPASWKSPQRDKDGLAVRYNLSEPDDYDRAVNASDTNGSFLYKR